MHVLILCLVPSCPAYMDQTLGTTTTSSAAGSISHNPFTSTFHPQTPPHPSQRSESSPTFQHSPHNPFVHPTLPTNSEDGKLPPLPPRKQPPPPSVPQIAF